MYSVVVSIFDQILHRMKLSNVDSMFNFQLLRLLCIWKATGNRQINQLMCIVAKIQLYKHLLQKFMHAEPFGWSSFHPPKSSNWFQKRINFHLMVGIWRAFDKTVYWLQQGKKVVGKRRNSRPCDGCFWNGSTIFRMVFRGSIIFLNIFFVVGRYGTCMSMSSFLKWICQVKKVQILN